MSALDEGNGNFVFFVFFVFVLCFFHLYEQEQAMRNDAHAAATKAVAAELYLHEPEDPLGPLAEALGEALAGDVEQLTSGGTRGKFSPDRKVDKAHIKKLVLRALDSVLTDRTDAARSLRMSLIGTLANQELGASPRPPLPAKAADMLLSTAQAADQLDLSRPHIAMLCDAGKLGEVLRTDGGHRRVRQSAVVAYRDAQAQSASGELTPRETGVEADLYGRDDRDYTNVVREQNKKNKGPSTRAKK